MAKRVDDDGRMTSRHSFFFVLRRRGVSISIHSFFFIFEIVKGKIFFQEIGTYILTPYLEEEQLLIGLFTVFFMGKSYFPRLFSFVPVVGKVNF